VRAAARERVPAPAHAAALGACTEADEPLALLHFGFRAVVRGPDAVLAERGLGRVHHRILFFVARTSPTVGDLLATLGISKQALHRPLQELVRAKLVVARPDADNRRVRRLTLSAAGAALERRLSGQQRRMFTVAFGRAGTAGAQGWRRVMRELIAHLA
jgi:DNA-binding MarR family transcriptional regulator